MPGSARCSPASASDWALLNGVLLGPGSDHVGPRPLLWEIATTSGPAPRRRRLACALRIAARQPWTSAPSEDVERVVPGARAAWDHVQSPRISSRRPRASRTGPAQDRRDRSSRARLPPGEREARDARRGGGAGRRPPSSAWPARPTPTPRPGRESRPPRATARKLRLTRDGVAKPHPARGRTAVQPVAGGAAPAPLPFNRRGRALDFSTGVALSTRRGELGGDAVRTRRRSSAARPDGLRSVKLTPKSVVATHKARWRWRACTASSSSTGERELPRGGADPERGIAREGDRPPP